MRPSRSLLVLLAASILVLGALNFVLTRNQAAGVYPIDADSISIPLFEGLVTIGLAFFASCIGSLVPRRGLFRIVGLFFSAIAALLLAESAWFWFIPNHYELAVVYFGLLVLCAVVFIKTRATKSR
ncbi:hypothetical protein Q8A64_01690 [Oxalobacteraceae bacterium R-40]|uniref:Uncharacterized protein n=1 Tax=Keguizhuia sedimenti TaxID=3064264 RepID=A0ABU1BJE8_9BURK|nr:hypothetical protein [Oxalobacteraceae bacterium R-40]